MNVRCRNCGRINLIPPRDDRRKRLRCYQCGAFLPVPNRQGGETSAAVGLIGGAALGAALGGPAGAIIGGAIGLVLGREAKGLG